MLWEFESSVIRGNARRYLFEVWYHSQARTQSESPKEPTSERVPKRTSVRYDRVQPGKRTERIPWNSWEKRCDRVRPRKRRPKRSRTSVRYDRVQPRRFYFNMNTWKKINLLLIFAFLNPRLFGIILVILWSFTNVHIIKAARLLASWCEYERMNYWQKDDMLFNLKHLGQ